MCKQDLCSTECFFTCVHVCVLKRFVVRSYSIVVACKMADSKMSTFESEFKVALSLEKKIPYNELLQSCLDILKKHNMLYTQTIDASQMLVHQKNRGGLMLSVHKVHTNAAVIATVGADRKQLTNAVCIDLCAEGDQRNFSLMKTATRGSRSAGRRDAARGSRPAGRRDAAARGSRSAGRRDATRGRGRGGRRG